MDSYIIKLVAPVPDEDAADIAIKLASRTKQDARKILPILRRGGNLAKSDDPEKAKRIAALFESYGLKVQIIEPSIEVDWVDTFEEEKKQPRGKLEMLNTPAKSEDQQGKRPAPLLGVLSIIGIIICFQTPKIILTLPLFLTLILAALSLFRRESMRFLSWIVIALSLYLFYWASSTMPSFGTSNSSSQSQSQIEALKAIEIVDQNWIIDPNFGTRGTIKWNVELKNISAKYVDSAKVEFTTYDEAGKLIQTDSTYITAIPPNSTRAEQAYADLYGTEKTARMQVVSVRFAQ